MKYVTVKVEFTPKVYALLKRMAKDANVTVGEFFQVILILRVYELGAGKK